MHTSRHFRPISCIDYQAACERLERHQQKPWWHVLVLPSGVALLGVAIQLFVARRETKLPHRYHELICPVCNDVPLEVGVLMTGHCSQCGTHLAKLPEPTVARQTVDLEAFRTEFQKVPWKIFAWMFGPVTLCMVGSGISGASNVQTLAMAFWFIDK